MDVIHDFAERKSLLPSLLHVPLCVIMSNYDSTHNIANFAVVSCIDEAKESYVLTCHSGRLGVDNWAKK